MKKAIITAAAGFTGTALTEALRKQNIETYAIVREGSPRNKRLDTKDPGLHIIECDAKDYKNLAKRIDDECDTFFHLLWTGTPGEEGQDENIGISLTALETAKGLGCKRYIATGSQAEYGIVPPEEIILEERQTDPITSYGKAKVKACDATKDRAEELEIDWIWGRIFSLIGKNEPHTRMLPALFDSLKAGRSMSLSSCRQNWDYLDVYDAAEGLIALAKNGKNGEIYNIANGDYRPLREYTETMRFLISPDTEIFYGKDPDPFISLQPSVLKIERDTGWIPQRDFEDSLRSYEIYGIKADGKTDK